MASKPLCLQSIGTVNIFRRNALLPQGRWEPALLNWSSGEETSAGPSLCSLHLAVAGRRALLQFSAVRPRGDPLTKGPSVQQFVAQPRFSHKLPRWTPHLLGSTSAGLCSRPVSEESSLGPGKGSLGQRGSRVGSAGICLNAA